MAELHGLQAVWYHQDVNKSPQLKARAAIFAALLGTMLATQIAVAADRFDAAVAHPGRSAADKERDVKDLPAQVLRLTKIAPGMRVIDMLGSAGYYSEILSYLVGSQGKILLLNNPSFDSYDDGWKARLAGDRLPNVTHRVAVLDALGLEPAAFDAALMIKVYHDLYWTELMNGPPVTDAKTVLNQIAQALKPGGILLVVDHSAIAGSGASAADGLHRIEQAFAIHDIESHGFELVKTADFLKNSSDDRSTISYKPPALGKTDRFIAVFRKRR